MDDPTNDDKDSYHKSKSFSLVVNHVYTFGINVSSSSWNVGNIICDAGVVVDSKSLSIQNGSLSLHLNKGVNGSCTFIVQQNNQITANIYNDKNKNGSKNSNESGLSQWKVSFYSPSGTLFTTINTNSSGNANTGRSLPGQGTYTVCETLQSGWTNTDPRTINTQYGKPCKTVSFTQPDSSATVYIGNAK